MPGVAKLPLSALREAQGRSAVWLLDKQALTVRSQAVTVATADGNEVVISEGLKPGDVVVTAGVHVLTAGQRVKMIATPATATATATAIAPQMTDAASAPSK
jgi:membrane fusion protein, multidrug efflux system